MAKPRHKFGIEEEAADADLARIAELPALRLEGIHVYAESCVLAADRLLAIHRHTLDLARRLAAQGLPISVVDFGGGLGVPYRPDETAFDLRRYGEGLRRLVESTPPDWRFLIEPGRYLCAEAGAYVVTVLDVKTSWGRRHVLVDGGIHHLYRPQMQHANRMVEILASDARADDGPRRKVTIGGPLLSGEDVLVEEVELPPVEVGDRLVFRHCGAYGFSHGLMGFSAHPTVAEAAIEVDGTPWLMRRRGRPSEVLRGQFANRRDHAVEPTEADRPWMKLP